MLKNIRRRRVNYLLPSENINLFRRMIGKPLLKFKVGMRNFVRDDICDQDKVNPRDALYSFAGNPFFIVFEVGHTVVFYDDDFLGSIVLREIEGDVDDFDFLDKLESQDCVGNRGRIRHTADLLPAISAAGNPITSISVLKLPDNYFGKPTGYDEICQCVIRVNISDIEEILFVSQINEENKSADLRISVWDRLDKNDTDNLICVWSSQW